MITYTVRRTLGRVKLFRSTKDARGAAVTEILPESAHKIVRGDGFEYGYSGTGPSQLAAAILLDAFAKSAPAADYLAEQNFVAFKLAFLGAAVREKQEFEVTQREILRWLSNRTLAGAR